MIARQVIVHLGWIRPGPTSASGCQDAVSASAQVTTSLSFNPSWHQVGGFVANCRLNTPQTNSISVAGEGNRTPDPRFTKPLLCQLSYAGAGLLTRPTAPRAPPDL